MTVRQIIRSRYWWLLLVLYWLVSLAYYALIAPNAPVGYNALVLLLLTLAIPLAKLANWAASPRAKTGEADSIKTLESRYAKGQITKAQYERMKKDLQK